MPSAPLEVGRIGKAHGLAGDVFVTLTTNRVERLEPGSTLIVDDRELEVVRSRPHQHRYVVSFLGVDSRESADELRGATVWAEPIDDPAALWVHEVVGLEVADMNGEIVGIVEAVEANPASDLLVLESGALVPMQFVVEHPAGGPIVIDPPAGLFDL